MRVWTIEKCRKIALNYKRKIDFLNGNNKAYDAAYRNKWLGDICNHMEISGDKYNRCIYAYEFPDNSVYIGLTYNLEVRDEQHKADTKSNNSCVLSHIKNRHLLPILVKLSDYINYAEASVLEGTFVNKYKENGWIILNKNITGSLGASNLIYTKEKCKEIIDTCVYLSDLYSTHGRVILICKENDWFLTEIDNLIKIKKSNNHWNKKNCSEISKSFCDIKDFIEKESSAYRSALKNGWLEEITSHMYISKKGKGYWTKEKCKEEAAKYIGKFAFQKGSNGAYKSAYKNKWLNEFFI